MKTVLAEISNNDQIMSRLNKELEKVQERYDKVADPKYMMKLKEEIAKC